MTLYMIELPVRDPHATAAWYGKVIGSVIRLVDDEHGFVLLTTPGSTVKLALKQSEFLPDTQLLHFQVADLAAEVTRLAALGIHPIDAGKTSAEGYTRVRCTDPDGRGVVLFEWTENNSRGA